MVADGPPLEVPAPPPRVIAPIDDTLVAIPQPLEPPTAVPPPTQPSTQTRRQPRAAENEGREPAVTPAPAAAVPATPTPTPEAPRDLRPAGSAADAEAEKKVRALMAQALQNLSRVDYRTLSVDNKAQYDESKRFVERAEGAIKDRNFVIAETYADKAATLAAQLVGR